MIVAGGKGWELWFQLYVSLGESDWALGPRGTLWALRRAQPSCRASRLTNLLFSVPMRHLPLCVPLNVVVGLYVDTELGKTLGDYLPEPDMHTHDSADMPCALTEDMWKSVS